MAFVGGDPDRVMAGTGIEIPALDGDLAASVRADRAGPARSLTLHAMVAPRTHGGARSLRRFVLTTSLARVDRKAAAAPERLRSGRARRSQCPTRLDRGHARRDEARGTRTP